MRSSTSATCVPQLHKCALRRCAAPDQSASTPRSRTCPRSSRTWSSDAQTLLCSSAEPARTNSSFISVSHGPCRFVRVGRVGALRVARRSALKARTQAAQVQTCAQSVLPDGGGACCDSTAVATEPPTPRSTASSSAGSAGTPAPAPTPNDAPKKASPKPKSSAASSATSPERSTTNSPTYLIDIHRSIASRRRSSRIYSQTCERRRPTRARAPRVQEQRTDRRLMACLVCDVRLGDQRHRRHDRPRCRGPRPSVRR
jgi:hypothetical protein